jgi:large conductance mechanosensitive channel
MSMLQEFKTFALRGNMMDLAVGVIIGAAFGKIVDSIVQDLIMPIVSSIFGGLDFANYYFPLKGQSTALPLLEAKKLGAVFAYGNFLTVLLNFLILAFIVFQMVRLINKARRAPPVMPAPVVTPEDVLLLREIRDALRK